MQGPWAIWFQTSLLVFWGLGQTELGQPLTVYLAPDPEKSRWGSVGPMVYEKLEPYTLPID